MFIECFEGCMAPLLTLFVQGQVPGADRDAAGLCHGGEEAGGNHPEVQH
jgi:hypothetical protein